ncbi:CBS domain-containing protein [Arcticibacter sp. MXS-1]|uniref:CBS domain-containing protein n=1 Tax=Arcticibacter sp. MXS-1 TaxID=3341726 RepID=UPI0035A845AF
MIARELISEAIPPLVPSDSVQKVLERMAEFRLSHLPVVEESQFLGVISDEDLFEVRDYSLLLSETGLSLNRIFVDHRQHIYEVIRLFYESRMSVVPVLDENRNYLGVVSVNTMMEYMASITSMKEPGGIIVLEMTNRNNSLSHIAQIVESNNARILSSYITSFVDSTRTDITIKLNRSDISGIVSAFLRYEYNVIATFNDIQNDSGTADRYDQLMNYLSF